MSFRQFVALSFSIFFSSTTLAAPSYRFTASLDALHQDLGHSAAGKASSKIYNISGSAYLNPIELDGSVPYRTAAFFSRTTSLLLAAAKSRSSGLNAVRGGRILKEMESNAKSATLQLARPDLPVWFKVQHIRYSNEKLSFSSGSDVDVEDRSVTEWTAGVFITRHISAYALYEKDTDKTYGAGIVALIQAGEGQFFEANLQHETTDEEKVDLVVVNNTIRNLDITPTVIKKWFADVKFFPNVNTYIGLGYELSKYDYAPNSKHVSFDAGYFFTNNFAIDASYQRESDNHISSNRFNYTAYTLSASLRF